MNVITILGLSWIKKTETYCGDYYGHYTNELEAKDACLMDSDCYAIYQEGCNGNEFRLCRLGDMEKVSSTGSCILMKSGNVLF